MLCSWRNGDNNSATAAAAVPSAQPALADGAAAQSAAAVAADATAGPGSVADRAAAVQPAVADDAANDARASGDSVSARAHHTHHPAQTSRHHRYPYLPDNVADPGCLSRIPDRFLSIPDPISLGSGIRKKPIPDPGSKKIRFRNTASRYLPRSCRNNLYPH
jgi:hypothetical protein